MAQMLVDDIGDVTITNDGATILRLLEVEHPAAKVRNPHTLCRRPLVSTEHSACEVQTLSVTGTCGVGERARPTPSASGRTKPAPAPSAWSASLAQHAQHAAAAQARWWGWPGRGTRGSSQQPTRRARRAQILVELAELQDQEVGDGTTSVVIVAAELLKRANVLVRNRIHPTSIISGYRLAMREARRPAPPHQRPRAPGLAAPHAGRRPAHGPTTPHFCVSCPGGSPAVAPAACAQTVSYTEPVAPPARSTEQQSPGARACTPAPARAQIGLV